MTRLKGESSSVLLDVAWRDFIYWAVSEPTIVAEFNEATGRTFKQPGTPIEEMIDEATGKDADDAEVFILWVTKNHWGMKYAPESVRKAIR
jgi:hypothetical protein